MDKETTIAEISGLIIRKMGPGLSAEENQRLDAWRSSSASNERLFQKIWSAEGLDEDIRLCQSVCKVDGWEDILKAAAGEDVKAAVSNTSSNGNSSNGNNSNRNGSINNGSNSNSNNSNRNGSINNGNNSHNSNGSTNSHNSNGLRRNRSLALRRYLSAAVVVLFLGTALVFLFHDFRGGDGSDLTGAGMGEGPVLVLSDGNRIDLGSRDSLSPELTGGTRIVKATDGLTYEGKDSDRAEMHELRIPRGHTYSLRLSDGSTVLLNAGTVLRYPDVFGSRCREVSLSGEAFFRIAPGGVPFVVKAGELAIRVYGTTFNVNTYVEDHVRTALVEGKVGITPQGGGREYRLTASQLADYSAADGKVSIVETDLTAYTAWTRGEFFFRNERLEDILSRLSLSYDVDIFYRNQDVKDLHFTGHFRKYASISPILEAMSETVDVRFDRNGRTILVGK